MTSMALFQRVWLFLCPEKCPDIIKKISHKDIVTVEPLILVALNFGVQVHQIILTPLILASVLTELRDCC